ncbi:MAG TPA: hypothetical protein VMS93_05380 [Candidatus Saccharimonadales bacterium]|nr:hypothetical protein [Candidatus Saccharimonadales bacterium]
MPSQKLVRCEVQSRSSPPSARYIPMEIYGLWEYLMVHKHGFEVHNCGASLWIDVEESPEVAYTESSYERVTEVTLFVYSEPDGMFTRVCRYFPTESYPELRSIFLAHYSSPDARLEGGSQLREKEGIWIRRSPVPATAS